MNATELEGCPWFWPIAAHSVCSVLVPYLHSQEIKHSWAAIFTASSYHHLFQRRTKLESFINELFQVRGFWNAPNYEIIKIKPKVFNVFSTQVRSNFIAAWNESRFPARYYQGYNFRWHWYSNNTAPYINKSMQKKADLTSWRFFRCNAYCTEGRQDSGWIKSKVRYLLRVPKYQCRAWS